MMTSRQDGDTENWRLRPWITAAVCMVSGLLFQQLTDRHYPVPAGRQALATFVAIASISFALTVEQRRWSWSLGFALGWGMVIGLVGWFTAGYNQVPTLFEWPFLSGIFAVLLAAPLFQTVRDEGKWRFPYARLHQHAWADAVIGGAALLFVGVTFLLAWLIAGLFHLIGLDFVKDLLQKSWFEWMLAGFAFGSAVGLLRERDGLVAGLQRLVMVVMSVLAPVLAAALLLFLLSLPFTGIGRLWNSSLSTTPLMLSAAAGAVMLANAVIGNGVEDRSTNRVLWFSAMVLVLSVLELALIAAVSLGVRIAEYGWTPERMWSVIAVTVALVYGAAGWWSVVRGRMRFDEPLRLLQTRIAIGLCGLALLLALPIVDFGAISARSQMARFASGRTAVGKFDWQAMAFAFGPAGRERLREIALHGPPDQRILATAALASKNRWGIEGDVEQARSAAQLDQRLRVLPAGTIVPPALRTAVSGSAYCRELPCALVWIDDRRAMVAGQRGKSKDVHATTFTLNKDGNWNASDDFMFGGDSSDGPVADVGTAPIEVRKVVRRQLFVDGKPVGDVFE
jgi:hypothetical protein